MSKEIKFKVRLSVDGKEQLSTATTNVDDLRKAVRDTENSLGVNNKDAKFCVCTTDKCQVV